MLEINNGSKYNRHNKIETICYLQKTKKPSFNFHVPLHPFHSAKLQKRYLRADPEFGGHSIFSPTITHSPSTKIFFAKFTNINFICLLAPFTVQNFKKYLECICSFDSKL